jgi:hypothetical protein
LTLPRKSSDYGDNKIKLDTEYPEAIRESLVYAYISEPVSRLSYKISSLLSHPNPIKTDRPFEKPHV